MLTSCVARLENIFLMLKPSSHITSIGSISIQSPSSSINNDIRLMNYKTQTESSIEDLESRIKNAFTFIYESSRGNFELSEAERRGEADKVREQLLI